jgi:hypothetical protein
LQFLRQDPPVLHKTLDFLGDMQTYLFICIHLFLDPAAALSEQSFFQMMPVFVTIGNTYRFAETLSIVASRVGPNPR